MSNGTQLSETDAIRQIIAAGNVMDYVDVVEAVRKKFGLTVSAVLVEEVHGQMRKEPQPELPTRIQTKVQRMEHAEDLASDRAEAEHPADHLEFALRFVRSVQGLSNAKRALAELESIMEGS